MSKKGLSESNEYFNKFIEEYLNKESSSIEKIKEIRIPIGKASKISSLSVRSIRHYCDIGLLTPAYTDEFTGYRYFSNQQLNILFLIREMRTLGFSLEEIKDTLKSKSIPEIVDHFDSRVSQLEKDIKALEIKKKKLKYLAENYSIAERTFAEENNKDYVITLKDIPLRYVVYISDNAIYANGLVFQNAYDEIDKIIGKRGFSNRQIRMAIFDSAFHEYFKNGEDVEEIYERLLAEENGKMTENKVDYCIEIEPVDDLKSDVKKIDKGLYACMMFRGEYEDLYSKGYTEFLEWIGNRRFSTDGNFMEIYHLTRPLASLGMLPITEVQVKIKI